MEIARTHSTFLVNLDPEDATNLGVYGGVLSLRVGQRRGTVDLVYAAVDASVSGGYREISDEPAATEVQALIVAHAHRNPVKAALALLALDIERRTA